jgi:hypothetical protein
MNLRRQGFNLGMVSFDRWQSFDIQNELQAVGIRTETVSVAKKHYEDLAMMIYEERVAMPMIPILLEEMSELKIMKGNRVDHPRKKSKDLADALCGAVFGAISHTPKTNNTEIEVHTWSSASRLAEKQARMVELDNREMPEEVREYLGNFNLL